jgi:hypothetical protein
MVGGEAGGGASAPGGREIEGEDAGAGAEAVCGEIFGREGCHRGIGFDESGGERRGVREGHERGGAGPCPEIEQLAFGCADGGAEQHGIEAGTESRGGLGDGQPAAQKGVMCDTLAFYNRSALG